MILLAAFLQNPPAVPPQKPLALALTVRGHDGRTQCLALSQDGKTAASAGLDHTLKAWDVDSGKLLGSVPHVTDYFLACALSRDGKRFAASRSDRVVDVFELLTGKQVSSIREDALITGIEFSADGNSILCVATQRIFAHDVLAPGKMQQVTGSDWLPANSVTLSWDGQTAALAGGSGLLQLCDVGGGAVIDRIQGVPFPLKHLAVSNGGASAAWSTASTLYVHSAKKKLKPEVLKKAHEDEITGIALSPQGKVLVTGDAAGVLKTWDTDPFKLRKTLTGHAGAVNAIAFSGDGKRFATAGEDGPIRIWENEALVKTLDGHESLLTSAAVSQDGTFVVTAGGDRSIRAWSLADGKPMGAVASADPKVKHESSAADVAAGPQSLCYFTYEVHGGRKGKEGQIRSWVPRPKGKADKGSKASPPEKGFAFTRGDEEDVFPVQVRAAGNHVAVLARFRKSITNEVTAVRIFDAAGHGVKDVEDPKACSMDIAPDGHTLLVMGLALKIADLGTGAVRDLDRFATLQGRGRGNCLARFTADGTKIMYAYEESKVHVIDVATGKAVRTLGLVPPSYARSVASGPEANEITVGCSDGTIHIFNFDTEKEVQILTGHREDVVVLAFSSDRKILVSGAYELKIWK